MLKSFQLISDPSHGWLKVPLAELTRLGIADKITSYSYVKGDYVFLEEDLDMTTFMTARNAEGKGVKVMEINRASCGKIRNYTPYSPCPVIDLKLSTVEPGDFIGDPTSVIVLTEVEVDIVSETV